MRSGSRESAGERKLQEVAMESTTEIEGNKEKIIAKKFAVIKK